jgi:hypothetical protein
VLALLLACWSPDPDAGTPELPPLDPLLSEDAPDTPDAPQDQAPDAAEAENAPPFATYPGATTAAPVTVVDDYGKPLTILQRAGVAVTVVGEEPIRKRVRCDVCTPAVEGWVQSSVVTARP